MRRSRILVSAPASSMRFCAFVAVFLGGSACTSTGSGTMAPLALRSASSSNIASYKSRAAKPAVTMSVDIRPYMAAAIGGTPANPGKMLCQSHPIEYECLTSVRDGDQFGEIKIIYFKTLGIVDYIGITSYNHNNPPGQGAAYYIGVIRNLTGANGQLRCFATYPNMCSSPANSFFMPEGVPYQISQLPVVSYDTVLGASNADGSPKNPIPGALITTPNAQTGDYWSFLTNNMDSNCAQTGVGEFTTKVLVAYVPSVPFGGKVGSDGGTAIGTLDAVVVDTFAIGGPGLPNVAERYFYASGLGRVEEGHSQSNGGPPYNMNTNNVVWNVKRNVDTSIIDLNQNPQCGQGSAWPLW